MEQDQQKQALEESSRPEAIGVTRAMHQSKVRGRKASMREIVKMIGERIIEPEKQTMFLSHGDCPEEAQALADMLKQQLGVQAVIVGPVGPVIGAHSGPAPSPPSPCAGNGKKNDREAAFLRKAPLELSRKAL